MSRQNKTITSPTNDTIKQLARLHKKKERDQQHRFLVEGMHMIQEASQAGCLETILIDEQDQDQITEMKSEIVVVTPAILKKLSLQNSQPKIIGVCTRPDRPEDKENKRYLILDEVQDPGNLGTLVRSAVSFGIDKVYLTKGCADPYGPKALQASQGAIFHIDTQYANAEKVIEQLRQHNIPVLGAALHQKSMALRDLPAMEQFALVLGNEGTGIEPDILSKCTQLVHIEMDAFESLNVAVAGSILLYVLRYGK